AAPTLIFHEANARPADSRFAGVELAAAPVREGRLDLEHVLRTLAERSVNELQVEAGPTLCGALFASGLADEVLLYIAPVLLGDQARPLLKLPPLDAIGGAQRLRVIDQRQIGSDLRLLLRE